MSRAALALLGTAAAAAAVDLAHKSAADSASFHTRSAAYVAAVVVLSVLWTVAIAATRSVSISVAGGVVAGGAAANLLSLLFWPGVPNPLMLDRLAFSLADIFVLAGFALVAGVILTYAVRNPDRLHAPLS